MSEPREPSEGPAREDVVRMWTTCGGLAGRPDLMEAWLRAGEALVGQIGARAQP